MAKINQVRKRSWDRLLAVVEPSVKKGAVAWKDSTNQLDD